MQIKIALKINKLAIKIEKNTAVIGRKNTLNQYTCTNVIVALLEMLHS